MATEKDFRVKSSIEAPTSIKVGDAEITATGSAVILPANSVILDGAGGTVSIETDLTGYATETYVNTQISNIDYSSYATQTDLTNGLATKVNTSSIATVALTGNYNDLSNTPTIPSLTGYATETYVDNGLALKADTSSLSAVATSGSYNDLSDLPSLFSGSYNDLSNLPTLFSGSYTDLTNKPTLFSGSYTDLTDKPTLYTDSDTGAYLTANGYATQLWVTSQNYLTAESDTLDAVTSRGNTTTNSITVANITSTGNVQIDGNLTVSGTQNIINTTDLAVEDNMIYLNDGSTVANPDLGIAGNYNDGTYAHAGIFRDATDGRWKFYDSYTPEPDASAFIDTTHGSFNLAPIEAGNIYLNGNLVATQAYVDNNSGGGIEYIVKTSNYTASANEGIITDTSSGAFTVTLPASPSVGDQVIIADGNDWSNNNLTIGRNGSTIRNAAEDLVCDIQGVSIQLIYDGATWEVYALAASSTDLSSFAKYGDTTANFTGTLQNGGSNVLVDTDIGSTVQAYDTTILKSADIGTSVQGYDADTAKYDDTTANFTGTLKNGGSNVVVDTDIGSTVGYPNIPLAGDKSSSYTLTTSDVGKYVRVVSGGSITIPNVIWSAGDAITIYNDTSSAITITCSTSISFIAGTDINVSSVTLASRGLATILFTGFASCVISGNVS